MLSKEKLFKQLDELNTNISLEKYELLYNAYVEKKTDKNILLLIDNIIKELFTIYSSEPLIPYKFFDTPLGQIILQVKYGIEFEEKVYYVNDISNILNISKQAVLKKIHSKEILAEKPGREWIVSQKHLNSYLNKIGKGELIMYDQQEEIIIVPDNEMEVKYDVNVKEK